MSMRWRRLLLPPGRCWPPPGHNSPAPTLRRAGTRGQEQLQVSGYLDICRYVDSGSVLCAITSATCRWSPEEAVSRHGGWSSQYDDSVSAPLLSYLYYLRMGAGLLLILTQNMEQSVRGEARRSVFAFIDIGHTKGN